MSDDSDQDALVIPGTSGQLRTMADGTVRVYIDFPPTHAPKVFQALGQPHTPVAVAQLTAEAGAEQMQREALEQGGGDVGHAAADAAANEPPKAYGQEARELVQSGFFRSTWVWRALGTDDDYLAWVRRQPSCVSGQYSEITEAGEKRNVAAHVRRASDTGTAHKPEFMAVPLTNAEHQRQHNDGEAHLLSLIFAGQYSRDDAHAWFQHAAVQHVAQWAYETLKAELGYAHLNQIPPSTLAVWADKKGIAGCLPGVYKENL